MILASHIIIAGVLASKTSVYAAAAIGLVSHYILDAIPHWDYLPDEFVSKIKTDKSFVKSKQFWLKLVRVGADALIGCAALFVFAYIYYSNINIYSLIVSAIFGILPDALNLAHWLTGWKFLKWNSDLQRSLHTLIFKKPKQKFRPGIATQIITVIITVLTVIRL